MEVILSSAGIRALVRLNEGAGGVVEAGGLKELLALGYIRFESGSTGPARLTEVGQQALRSMGVSPSLVAPEPPGTGKMPLPKA